MLQLESPSYSIVGHALLVHQVVLGVDNQPRFASKGILKELVARRQRNAVVATLNNQIDRREHRLHLAQTGGMMSEEVGALNACRARETASGNEFFHGGSERLARICGYIRGNLWIVE